MTDDLDALPLAEADRRAREQIEHHQNQMAAWSGIRARRILAERNAGRSAVDIARELGVTPQAVYQLTWRAQKDAAQGVQ